MLSNVSQFFYNHVVALKAGWSATALGDFMSIKKPIYVFLYVSFLRTEEIFERFLQLKKPSNIYKRRRYGT